MAKEEQVSVPRSELEELLKEADEFIGIIDDLSSYRYKVDPQQLHELSDLLLNIAERRVSVSLLRFRLQKILKVFSDPNKTPIRPPSQQALKAFQESSEFDPTSPGRYKKT